MKLRIITGDTVKVMSGKDKGKTGKVVQTFPALNRVVVEGVNVCKRHIRTRKKGEKGQIMDFSMPIHASNLRIVEDSGRLSRQKAARASAKNQKKDASKTGKETV